MAELQEHEKALRALWRELAEKRIESGIDWPGIARDLFRDLDNAEHELTRLRQWKREAVTLFDGLQDLGRALDLPLGCLVTGPLAIEAAATLRAERDAALAEVARLVSSPAGEGR